MKYRWHFYFAHGRKQIRIGIKRHRRDRISPEYRFIALEWSL